MPALNTANTDLRRPKCAEPGRSPEDWFPPGVREGHDNREQARELCAGCPVQTECAQFALDNRIRYGIFGGLTERQRLDILSGAEARPTLEAYAA